MHYYNIHVHTPNQTKSTIITVITIICIIAFALGYTILMSSANSSSITLNSSSHVHVVSVDYMQHRNSKNNKLLNHKVNNYLNRIRNLKDYHVSVKPASVGNEDGVNKESTLTETIQFNRKK